MLHFVPAFFIISGAIADLDLGKKLLSQDYNVPIPCPGVLTQTCGGKRLDNGTLEFIIAGSVEGGITEKFHQRP